MGDNRKPPANEQIYIPQHPGGRPKEIGVFDSNHNGNCRVLRYSGGCAPEDMRYTCDTEGGSSGSPVLSRTNNKVVALHHCGGGCNGNLGAPIYQFYNQIQGFIQPPAPVPSSSPTDSPTASPTDDLCGILDVVGQTMFLPGVPGANACWRVQLGAGGTLEADFSDPSCSKDESQWKSTNGIFSYFESIQMSNNTVVFNPGPNGFSGSFQFKEDQTVTEPSLQILSFDSTNKRFELQVNVPHCFSDAICPTMKTIL